MSTKSNSIQRGDVYYADLDPVYGSEQGGVRPVLIIQNDVGNRYSPTVIVAPITSQKKGHHLPTHVWLEKLQTGLETSSTALLEQVRTIDRKRLSAYLGNVGRSKMEEVNHALGISMGMVSQW